MALGVGAYLGKGGYSRKYGTAIKYIVHHLILYFRVFTKACTVSCGAVFFSNLLKGKWTSVIMRKKAIFFIFRSQFNITFTSAIYKCSYCFQTLKQ